MATNDIERDKTQLQQNKEATHTHIQKKKPKPPKHFLKNVLSVEPRDFSFVNFPVSATPPHTLLIFSLQGFSLILLKLLLLNSPEYLKGSYFVRSKQRSSSSKRNRYGSVSEIHGSVCCSFCYFS